MRERETTYTRRRSIRRFENEPIENEKLTEVLEAARWAPSWANSQCCQIIVVQGDSLKNELALTLSKKNPATLSVQMAPVVLVLCALVKTSGYYRSRALTKFGDWFMFDIGVVAQNICLCAHELDLGTVIVGAFDHDKVKELIELPEGYEVVCIIPLGYPAHDPPAPARKELEAFVHQERFQKK